MTGSAISRLFNYSIVIFIAANDAQANASVNAPLQDLADIDAKSNMHGIDLVTIFTQLLRWLPRVDQRCCCTLLGTLFGFRFDCVGVENLAFILRKKWLMIGFDALAAPESAALTK